MVGWTRWWVAIAVAAMFSAACEPSNGSEGDGLDDVVVPCAAGDSRSYSSVDLDGTEWLHLTAGAGPFMIERTLALKPPVPHGRWEVWVTTADPGDEQPDTPQEQVTLSIGEWTSAATTDLASGVIEAPPEMVGVAALAGGADQIRLDHLGVADDPAGPVDSVHVREIRFECATPPVVLRPPCPVDDATQHCTLGQLADLAGLRLGVALDAAQVADDRLAVFAAANFNGFTSENRMKWQFIQPAPGDFTPADADALVELAEIADAEIRGHTLVWDTDGVDASPEWLTSIDDADELEAAVRAHFAYMFDRYGDSVDRWDVVNEPLETLGTGLQDNVFARLWGADWVARLMTIARELGPEHELWVNETALEFLPAKADAFESLVTDLAGRGLIDGVGLQGHLFTPPDLDGVADLAARFSSLGLAVAFTEVDVPIGLAVDDEEAQAEVMAGVVEVCLADPGCEEVTFWGLTDGLSWLNSFVRPGLRPLLFNDDLSPKPAVAAIEAVLRDHLNPPEPTLGLTGDLSPLHDPDIAEEDGWFYVFSTGDGVPIRRSRDLVHWENVGSVFDVPHPAWIDDYEWAAPGMGLGAPDVEWFGGRWHLYYHAHEFATPNAVTGHAWNLTLDPDDPDYDWVDDGLVMASTADDGYSVLDANALVDSDGTPWMTFGSFWTGIQLVELDPATGAPVDDAELTLLASRDPWWQGVEASSTIYRDGYWYLVTSWGFCCQGVETEYELRVGRSADLDGPYLDREGQSLIPNGGSLLLGAEGRMIGPGSGDVLTTSSGETVLVHHFYDGDNDGATTLGVRHLEWDEDGWPMVMDPDPLTR